jgi:diguanylate cyclase (GGDEF)-like protein
MTSASSGTGKKEQRRHARLATSQTAHIRFGEGEAILAEIRDYCQTGLYVAFPGARTPDAAIPALVGDSVQVAFVVDGSGALRCRGRVAHVSPGGVGVFTATLSEAIVQTLRTASGQRAQPDSNGLSSGLSPQQAQALQRECTSQFRSFLDTVMLDFFQRALERLAEAGQDEPSFLERSRFGYGVQELTQRRSRIEDDFFNAIRDRIQYVGSITEASSEGETANRLSLVDEAEFEDWLSLSAVIKQIESDIASPLGEFEQRYSRLTGMRVDRKNNPLGPESIGHAFQDAIQVLDFSNPMRAILYKALGQAVSNQGLAVYQQLNQTLASLPPAALPEPGRDRAKPKPDPAAAVQTAESHKFRPDLAEIADTLNALYKQDQTGAPQTPESAEYSLDRILATLNQSQRRAASETPVASAARSSRQTGAVPGHPAAARPDILQMVSRLQQTARQMGGRDASALRAVAATGGAGTALAEVSLRELQLALEGLPLVNQATAGKSVSLTDQIDAYIAASGGEARRIAPGQRLILDTTADLFARARADFVPSSDVELLVKRLERPLLKLALQDADFPNQPDHPARQVLNLIEQYAVAADDQGKFFDAKLQRFLYLLVDRVCSRADADPAIFGMVRDSLEKVLLPILQIRRTRVARLQEASEGRERIRSARTRVNAALEQRLAGREVPAMLLRLLDAGWRQYLILLELRQGAQGESWDAGLAVLDRLYAEFSPADADTPRIPETNQVLLGEIERTLAMVNVDAKLLAVFMDELSDRLSDASSHAAAGAAMVLVPPGRLAPSQGEGGEAPAHRRLADRLRVGDWWDFNLDGGRVSMQLIWVSQPPLSCAFSNRSATSKTDLTLAELARRMQSGLVKPGKDLDMPLFERSEHALFDETYQRMVHQAMHDPVTGLLNRKGFMQHLNQLAAPDQEGKAHAIGIIEFDQLRMINNTCGVEAAEGLARILANEVRAQIGPDAALATFRDDTLAVVLPNRSRDEGCQAIDSLLKQVKDHPFQHGPHSYSIGFNIGLTEYAPTRFSAVEAIRRADSACITAKSMGRNRMQIYEQASPQLQSQESMMDWAGRLDSFLKGNGLYLRCQQVRPIGADTSRLPYYEILLGIDNEAGQEVSPMHFVPAVESLQRSHELDIWVMQKVFEWIRANPSDFASLGGFAINLSANSLSNPEVMAYLQQVLPGSDLPTHKIAFEITETAAIESYGAAQDFIREIRRYGCTFSLDDFGSGFTSYAHLKNLHTDTLKIDGSFVRDMLQNPDDYAMVKSMNDIGHSLGLITVAEYVESPLILDALREIGVDYAQGYAIHKPCRIDELLSAQVPVFGN